MSKLRIAAAAFVVGWIALATSLAIYERLHKPFHLAIPTPVMPVPNAYDVLLQAHVLDKETDTTDAGIDRGLLPGESAPTQADYDRDAANNMPAVAEVREALKYPYMQPPERSHLWFPQGMAYCRSLSRILAFEGRNCVRHGKWDDAMGYYVDCIQLGSEIPHGAGIGAALTGSACETIGRCHASEAVEHVSAGAALRDASRLAEIDESQASPAQTLQEEEWTSYSLATEFFRDRNWRSAYVQLEVAGTSTVTPVDLVVARLKTYLVVPETAIEDTVGQINFEMKLSRLSYPAALKVRRPRPPKICDGSDGTEYWRWLADTLRSRNVTFALDRLLETQLALRAYKLEHGAYPVTLAALAPRYLPRIPLDPFSDERQLKYRLFGKSYLLYSIGPDAKDDGGTPIDDPSSKYRRHRVLESVIGKSSTYQTGDIVAGVNR